MAIAEAKNPNKSNVAFSGPAARPSWDNVAKSFTFEYLKEGESNEVTLFINPESFSQTEPARVSVTQTKGGFFIDHFGQGLKTIVISGVTGYKERKIRNMTMSGQKQFLKLREMYREWLDGAKEKPNQHIMRFYNWSDDEAYEIVITSFALQRTVSRPLLYQYNIQITAIRKLEEPPSYESDYITDYLLYESNINRGELISRNLYQETGFLNNIIKGIGLENFSKATKIFQESMSRGLEFFDSISGTYKKVESIISEVEDVARDIEMVVNGATTFVTKPFELVRDLAVSIEDIISQLVSIKNIPHEVVRSFREMICAIQSLPESFFKGFTNPSLFEGASNCGTTMGISEASVSSYLNSFSSTVQVPPERKVSQIFRKPKIDLKLKEEPLKVNGVFLETDIERIGVNYLESYFGSNVKLSSIPSVPVIIDYFVKQETAQNMVRLETAAAHIVKIGDSLIRIALKFYEDPSRWKEIALYNGLEYPYIIEELKFKKEIKAIGMVRFYRAEGYSEAITIPAGHFIYVPEQKGTRQINFRTKNTVVLNLIQNYVDVEIEAEKTGEIGNVATGIITGFSPLIGIEKVKNINPTSGGKIWRVALPGDIILVPKTEKEIISTIVPAKKDYEQLFGIDIAVNNGEFDFGIEANRDLARAYGVKNLIQAVKHRILTGKGYYPYNSNYGTNLPIYIGKKGSSHWHNLIRIDISDNVLQDPRIQSLKNFLMEIDGQVVSITFDAITVSDQSSLPLSIIV